MASIKKKVDLIGYSHNRDSNYKVTADEIFNLINNFTDQQEFDELYNYFDKKYQLPKLVVRQKIRQYLATTYLYKQGKFENKLCIKNIPKSILRYGALIYALFFVKINIKTQKFKLIIDDIYSSLELKRFERLLNLVGKDKVLCITRNIDIKQEFPECRIHNKKKFRDFELVSLLKSIFYEFSSGIWLAIKVSFKTRTNLLPVSLQIVHSYLSFKTLFESNISKYMIQERHHKTNPIKNYLFKKTGGMASTTIQKNIFQTDPMFFYMDTDILFSLGQSGFSEFLEYGGHVQDIVPVGSLAMEYDWFSSIDVTYSMEKKYDVLFLGINLADRMDSYNGFLEDYYSSFKWLARFKKENPNYKVGIIHHSSQKIVDEVELEILVNSGVEVIDKNDNSYLAAFSSHCAVTYGSTMGYELNAHKLPTFFVDPGGRCTFLPSNKNDFQDSIQMKSYESFSESVKAILTDNEIELLTDEQSSRLCLNSSAVSEKIYSSLHFINKPYA